MTTFVFPGQGSQKKGIGAGLFEKFDALVARADELLGYSVKELCLQDPGGQLNQTQYTQPALYIVNALSYLNLIEADEKRPDFVAGHSLGEYSALFAAGAFDFQTGLQLVKKRGELMSQVSGGGMAAVVGGDEARILKLLADHSLTDIEVANYNAPGQIIVSGVKDALVRAKPIFEASGFRCVLLPVSGAFHSRFMRPVQEEFTTFLRRFDYGELLIPIVSNVEAGLYRKDTIVELLSRQLTNSVRWSDSVRFLLRKGEVNFVEVGPGNVLTKLIEKIRQEPLPIVVPKPQPSITQEQRSVVGTRSSLLTDVVVRESPPQKNGNGNGSAGQSFKFPPNLISQPSGITAASFGDSGFKTDYGIKYAYVAGGIGAGISSSAVVLRMAGAGLLAYFGAGGLELSQIEAGIREIQRELKQGQPYGMSLVSNPEDPGAEEAIVDLFLKYGIKNVEADGYIQITPSLVRYRLKGLSSGPNGQVVCGNRLLAKVSHPDVAESFLRPAPERVVERLLSEKKIERHEAELAATLPLADDLCIASDCGWHSDQSTAQVLLPIVQRLRDELTKKYQYQRKVRVGSADGIGTPPAVAASFFLGADFIQTGSLNQCSVEASLSESAKDLLELMSPQDTEQAPVRELFEMGGKVSVLKRGLLFPARANKLYELYRQYGSLEEIDQKTRRQLEERYFKRSFDEVYAAVKSSSNFSQRQIEEAEQNPKQKMSLVFKWYLDQGRQLALRGDEERRVDYQIQCDPALGAFNQWTRGTALEKWRGRHVDEIAEVLMNGAAEFSKQRCQALAERS